MSIKIIGQYDHILNKIKIQYTTEGSRTRRPTKWPGEVQLSPRDRRARIDRRPCRILPEPVASLIHSQDNRKITSTL